jgi:hypothetical protein
VVAFVVGVELMVAGALGEASAPARAGSVLLAAAAFLALAGAMPTLALDPSRRPGAAPVDATAVQGAPERQQSRR